MRDWYWTCVICRSGGEGARGRGVEAGWSGCDACLLHRHDQPFGGHILESLDWLDGPQWVYIRGGSIYVYKVCIRVCSIGGTSHVTKGAISSHLHVRREPGHLCGRGTNPGRWQRPIMAAPCALCPLSPPYPKRPPPCCPWPPWACAARAAAVQKRVNDSTSLDRHWKGDGGASP